MANPLDFAQCAGTGSGDLSHVDPFFALRFHFGMLLGVDDFETEQAYHRGKMRLHNAWLHREGVVWGLGVQINAAPGEVQVNPGLALDVAGHELHLDAAACLNFGAWYAQHANDTDLQSAVSAGNTRYNGGGTPDPLVKFFDAHVVVRFKACLTREVPALLEPCDGATADTAFSRVAETVELLLVPGPAPARTTHYHRLRLLFGLEGPKVTMGTVDPADQAVLDAQANIKGLPSDQQAAATLAAFRRFAALDEIDARPFTLPDGTRTLFPGGETDPLVLAELDRIKLVQGTDGSWSLADANLLTVDPTVRPVLVDTATIQELLGGGGGGATLTTPVDAGGPRVKAVVVDATDATIVRLGLTKPLSPGTLRKENFSITTRALGDPNAVWTVQSILTAAPDMLGTDPAVKLTLSAALGTNLLVRIIAAGTGPMPLLGSTEIPLAGAVGGPPGSANDGHDFVAMIER